MEWRGGGGKMGLEECLDWDTLEEKEEGTYCAGLVKRLMYVGVIHTTMVASSGDDQA